MKRGLFLLTVLSLFSCNSEIPWAMRTEMPDWGTEVVFNDCEEEILFSLVDEMNGQVDPVSNQLIEPLVKLLPSGESFSILTPGEVYRPCLHNAEYVEISLGGCSVKLDQGSEFFSQVAFEEEVRYEGRGKERVRYKWPVYTYHITKEILGIE